MCWIKFGDCTIEDESYVIKKKKPQSYNIKKKSTNKKISETLKKQKKNKILSNIPIWNKSYVAVLRSIQAGWIRTVDLP